MSNALFWISLASGAIVLALITFFRFAQRNPAVESPQADELPTGGDRPAADGAV